MKRLILAAAVAISIPLAVEASPIGLPVGVHVPNALRPSVAVNTVKKGALATYRQVRKAMLKIVVIR